MNDLLKIEKNLKDNEDLENSFDISYLVQIFLRNLKTIFSLSTIIFIIFLLFFQIRKNEYTTQFIIDSDIPKKVKEKDKTEKLSTPDVNKIIAILKGSETLIPIYNFYYDQKKSKNTNYEHNFIKWRKGISITNVRNTSILIVEYKDDNKDLSLKIGQKVLDQFQNILVSQYNRPYTLEIKSYERSISEADKFIDEYKKELESDKYFLDQNYNYKSIVSIPSILQPGLELNLFQESLKNIKLLSQNYTNLKNLGSADEKNANEIKFIMNNIADLSKDAKINYNLYRLSEELNIKADLNKAIRQTKYEKMIIKNDLLNLISAPEVKRTDSIYEYFLISIFSSFLISLLYIYINSLRNPTILSKNQLANFLNYRFLGKISSSDNESNIKSISTIIKDIMNVKSLNKISILQFETIPNSLDKISNSLKKYNENSEILITSDPIISTKSEGQILFIQEEYSMPKFREILELMDPYNKNIIGWTFIERKDK